MPYPYPRLRTHFPTQKLCHSLFGDQRERYLNLTDVDQHFSNITGYVDSAYTYMYMGTQQMLPLGTMQWGTMVVDSFLKGERRVGFGGHKEVIRVRFVGILGTLFECWGLVQGKPVHRPLAPQPVDEIQQCLR